MKKKLNSTSDRITFNMLNTVFGIEHNNISLSSIEIPMPDTNKFS